MFLIVASGGTYILDASQHDQHHCIIVTTHDAVEIFWNSQTSQQKADIRVLSITSPGQISQIHLRCEALHLQTECEVTLLSLVGKQGKNIGKAHLSFHQDSLESRGSLRHETIFLDDSGQCSGTPELFIGQKQAQASHSFSAGKLSRASLAYLEGRGLSLEQAKKVLITGKIRHMFPALFDNNTHEGTSILTSIESLFYEL